MSHRILFVCLGNICRSPLAEAIFNHKINALGLSGKFEADSCGTGNYHIGDLSDPRTIQCALNNSVSIHHQARQLEHADGNNFDLILAMDHSNYIDILRVLDISAKPKVKLMREFDPQGAGDVPDPYHGGARDFQHVFDILDRSMDLLIAQLK